MQPTPERLAYHKHLAAFTARLVDGAIVYDVGRHRIHNYAELFQRQTYRSIDRDPAAGADILFDVEKADEPHVPGAHCADAIMVNGVTEVCGDPFALARGAFTLLKPGGLALWGIMGPGYPLMEGADYTRFTPKGTIRLLTMAGFSVESHDIIKRSGVPSYCYVVCRRPPLAVA